MKFQKTKYIVKAIKNKFFKTIRKLPFVEILINRINKLKESFPAKIQFALEKSQNLQRSELSPTLSKMMTHRLEFLCSGSDNHVLIICHTADMNVSTSLYRAVYLGHSISLNKTSVTIVTPQCNPVELTDLVDRSCSIVLQRLFVDGPEANRSIEKISDLILNQAKKNTPIIGDIDDLLYPEFIDQIGPVRSGTWTKKQGMYFVSNTDIFTRKMDGMLVSSKYLADYISKKYNIPIVVRRNKLPKFAFLSEKTQRNDSLRLIFTSGSKTHQQDFAIIAKSLICLLKKCENVSLTILGRLDVQKDLSKLPNVRILDYVSHSEMFSVLAQHDLCLVPLENNLFNEAKSNLKYVQAGMAGIAVAASQRAEYLECIQNEVNGFLVSDDGWEDLLFRLAKDPIPAYLAGRKANINVLRNHVTHNLESEVFDILQIPCIFKDVATASLE